MQKNIKILTVLTLFTILLLSLSGMLGGVIGNVVYLLSFALPLCIGFEVSRRDKEEREKEKGACEPSDRLFSLPKKALLVIPVSIFPTVLTVFLISFVSTLIANALEVNVPPNPKGDMWQLLLTHALAPAILEEAVFRYLPLRLIAPYSKRASIIVSTVFFGFYHMSLFQIPYALWAGFIFIVLDLLLESVWPSVILHLLNNAASILFMTFTDDLFVIIFWLAISMLAVASFAVLAFFAKRFAREIRGILKSDIKASFPYSFLAVPVVSLVNAFITLFLE